MKIELSEDELHLILIALPYVGDREFEEEVDHDERIGEKCDALADKLIEAMADNYLTLLEK